MHLRAAISSCAPPLHPTRSHCARPTPPRAVFSRNVVLNITRKQREWRFYEFLGLRVDDLSKVMAVVSDIRKIVKQVGGCWEGGLCGGAGGGGQEGRLQRRRAGSRSSPGTQPAHADPRASSCWPRLEPTHSTRTRLPSLNPPHLHPLAHLQDSRVIQKLHRRVFLDKITREEATLYLSFYCEAANRDAFMASESWAAAQAPGQWQYWQQQPPTTCAAWRGRPV